jgi:hypothetical protein
MATTHPDPQDQSEQAAPASEPPNWQKLQGETAEALETALGVNESLRADIAYLQDRLDEVTPRYSPS